MEENKSRGLFGSVGSIIRLILGVVIVVVVAFLLIRFISGRQEANDAAQDAAETTSQNESNQEEVQQNTDSSDSSSDGNTDQTESSTEGSSSGSQTDDVPTGIADGEGSTANVPNVGAGSSALVIAAAIAVGVFTVFKSAQLVKRS